MVRQFTAKDARELAGPTIEERVDDVLIEIEKAARDKKRELRLYDDFWTKGSYYTKDDYLKACKLLEDLGYDIFLDYDDGCQFANVCTIVRW